MTIEEGVRITRAEYPEIIQAARWMDEDHGTPHFEPGIGFVVDDPEGLIVPERWVAHVPTIEAALAGLDHLAPHPLDVDTLACLAREKKEPTIFESAVRCFISGEHTPVTAMANSSRELFVANRFFNERFEGWDFDPAAGFTPTTPSPDASPDSGEALIEAAAKAMWQSSHLGSWEDGTGGSVKTTDYDRQVYRDHARVAAEIFRPTPSPAIVKEAGEVEPARAFIATLVDAAEAIAWQAGVGGRETAGAIVSYLATSPDEIDPFFAGKLSPIDFAGDWMRGGRLSWHGADGKVWTPEAAAAARAARDAALEPMSPAAEAQLA